MVFKAILASGVTLKKFDRRETGAFFREPWAMSMIESPSQLTIKIKLVSNKLKGRRVSRFFSCQKMVLICDIELIAFHNFWVKQKTETNRNVEKNYNLFKTSRIKFFDTHGGQTY